MTFTMFLRRVTKTAQKGLKINFSSVGEKVTLRGFDPRRDRTNKLYEKTDFQKSVFSYLNLPMPFSILLLHQIRQIFSD